MVVDIEVAYKIEEMKKNGSSDREIGQALGISGRAVLYTRQALGIRSGQIFRAYNKKGLLVAEGTATDIGNALGYTSSAVRKWSELKKPPYRVERVK